MSAKLASIAAASSGSAASIAGRRNSNACFEPSTLAAKSHRSVCE